MIVQDINLFRIGERVDIENVDAMTNVVIERISESGVTISGSIGQHIVISGKSPVSIHQEKMISISPLITGEKSGMEENKTRVKRGSLIEKMAHIELPGEVFTIKLLAEYNDIPIPYAAKWVAENCIECGKAQKEEGARGRAATLYKIE